MKRYVVIAGAMALVAIIVAAIVPLWVMTAGVSLPSTSFGPIALLIIGCFGVGGGLIWSSIALEKATTIGLAGPIWTTSSPEMVSNRPFASTSGCRPSTC